jgi:hypothetical protein
MSDETQIDYTNHRVVGSLGHFILDDARRTARFPAALDCFAAL